MPSDLPVLEIADAIVDQVRAHRRLVLTAPTGSGKTTQVPQIIYRSGLGADSGGGIVVCQPRRLATRLVARRVAAEMNAALGSLVGYQTRHDSAVSSDTRVRFVTEGLLLRRLQSQPHLPGVGVVVLDEFHERSVNADLTLALLKRLQRTQRPDLAIVVMSATLDADAVSSYLDAPAVRAEGRAFPVEITHLRKPPAKPVWDLAADALRDLGDAQGDVLVFMPRVFEINRTIDACRRVVSSDVDVLPLHGSLPPADQDRAVTPSNRRKVIVATNVAETSITIDGVTVVIDSGLANIHRYDPARALNVLRVEPISQASADQRAGRAGRTSPGACVRLWTAKDHASRDAQTPPEIRRVEFAQPMLTLKAMGVIDTGTFDWLDAPTGAAVNQAAGLLHDLNAVDDEGALTVQGKAMASLPAHPRIARMLLEASERGCLKRALTWAALIAERDIATRARRSGANRLKRFMEPDEPASDLAVRERALDEARAARFAVGACESIGVHAQSCREVDRVAKQLAGLAKRMNLSMHAGTTEDLVRCVLVAFGGHVAVKIDGGRSHCEMPGRKRVELDSGSVVETAGPLVALDLREVGRGDGRSTLLGLASAVELEWLRELRPDLIETVSEPTWNAEALAVEQVDRTLYSGMTVETVARPTADPSVAAEMFVERIVAGELRLEKWDDSADQWIARVRFVAAHFPERGLITYSDDDVRIILHEIVDGATRWNQTRDRPVFDKLRYALDWDDVEFVERMAPAKIDLPSGHRMSIVYDAESVDAPPIGRAKIQQLYGLDTTPTVAGGRAALTLEILGPNYRPVQKTSDLASFWANTYPGLRKELKRRYPKHEWR